MEEEMEHEYEEISNLLEELCKYCLSDELTLPTLQEKMTKLEQFTSHDVQEMYGLHPFFHYICLSKSISTEIVEYILDNYPYVATMESESDSIEFEDFGITYGTYPLHLACYNSNCTQSIIRLIMERYPAALRHLTSAGNLFNCGEDRYEGEEGFPLHYYIIRKTNLHIETIKMLIEANPDAMGIDGEMCFTPMHTIVSTPNENINNLLPIVAYLIEAAPSCIRIVDHFERTPLSLACSNKHITLEVVQFLYNSWPEASRLGDDDGYLPIHGLCCNEQLDDNASLEILRFMLDIDIDPGLVRAEGPDEHLPIHYAIRRMAFEPCKVLIDAYPESLRAYSDRMLPIHIACRNGSRVDTIDTIQYMLELDPDLINVMNRNGVHSIHIAAGSKRVDIIELLLKHDPSAASTRTSNLSNNLPLHSACASNRRGNCTEVIEALFDEYPQAINIHNHRDKTPLDLARTREVQAERDPNDSDVVNFLQTQRAYALQARDIKVKATLDKNDWQSLCCALKDNAPLGSIKLLVGALRWNPATLRVGVRSIVHTDSLPLDTACQYCSVKVVRYRLGLDNIMDEDLSSMHLLHSACRGANLDVIKYFLDEHTSLVALAEVNENGELPIHLLCEAGKDMVDNADSTEYIETIWRMLLANPEVSCWGLR